MAQASLFGIVEKVEYQKTDGETVRKLAMNLSNVLTVNVTYFNDEFYLHINKKKNDKVYYLPLSWTEADDVVLQLKTNFVVKDLDWLKEVVKKEQEGVKPEREVRMHPYQRPQRLQQQPQLQQQPPQPQPQQPQLQQQPPQPQPQQPQLHQSQLDDFVFY